MTTQANKPIDPLDKATSSQPDMVGTPEGDNEFAPDAPLVPALDGLQIPQGNAPQPFDSDHADEGKKPSGIEKFIDEVVRGEYM